MREITIKISGNCDVFTIAKPIVELTKDQVEEYSWIPDMVDEDLVDGCIFYELPFMMHIDEVVWCEDDGEEQRITKKGKYIKRKDFVSKILPTPPFVWQQSDCTYCEFEYLLELNDDDVFDPQKLQLVKSDYELSFVPYGVVVNYVVYDGKEVGCINYPEFDLTGSQCYLYEEAIPYVA